VDDLLDLAAGKAELAGDGGGAKVDDVMEKVLDATYGRALQKSVHVETHVPPDAVLHVRADSQDLERVLTNLIDNAVKYTEPEGRVSVRVEEQDDTVRVTISDTGIGIAREELARVFDEFYRAQNAKEVEREGTGLGLAIVKRIVERSGGRISVESELGKGTTFTVLLLRADDEPYVAADRTETPEQADEA